MNTRATTFFDSLSRAGCTMAENPGAKLFVGGRECAGFAEDTFIKIEPTPAKGETEA